ncbi:MAG: type IV pilus modification protein PilV [Pseudomonadales bacterium]|nr:type IV pilus modification protein PilV [Pseudomonadales bacterium]
MNLDKYKVHKYVMIQPSSGRAQSGGFTLLEVLITVILLAIGLLGFASLQVASVNNNLDAFYKSQATIIAQDMASRIHINKSYANWDNRAPAKGTAASAVTVEGNLGDLNLYINNSAAQLKTGHVCSASNPAAFHPSDPVLNCRNLGVADPVSPTACDEQEMAAFDVWEVCRAADEALPEGRVHVRCQDKAGISFTSGGTTQINPRNIEFDSNHRYFDPEQDPPVLLTGTDTDACSPGSLYTIYVSWRRAQPKTGNATTTTADDVEKDLVSNNTNYRCSVDLGFTQASTDSSEYRDCVALDLVP